MKKPLFAIVLAGLAACSPGQVESDPAADEAAIRELIRQTEAANNAADTLGWVSLFAEDAVYMPPGMSEVMTREGLREAAALGFGGYAAAVTITPSEIVVSGDWAFARSQVSGTVTSRTSGESFPVNVKQIAIYHRQPDGGWRIARLMTNSNE